jgi:protein-tyrosine phosphatase
MQLFYNIIANVSKHMQLNKYFIHLTTLKKINKLLSFLRSKTLLKDLIPDNHIDIHSHLLPGIDDGAKTIEETSYLINNLLDFGVKKIITTPHVMNTIYPNNSLKIISCLEKTVLELSKKENRISINAAAEYFMDDTFLENLKSEKLLTLKENYVLVEMSYMNPPIQLYDIIFEIQVAGYKPILAHPERYFFYHKSFDEYTKLKKSGCDFQLNMLSTVGYYGADVAKTADLLLKKGMINFVGSDVHHKNHIEAFHNKLLIKQISSFKEAIDNNQFFT